MESESPNASWTIARVIAAAGAILPTIYAILGLRTLIMDGFSFGGLFVVFVAFIAMILLWFALRGGMARTRQRLTYTFIGGIILGYIGFAIGFFGPLIFTPESNQGPLVGIFITGPIGFLAGCILGAVYALFRIK
jgi:hypothetical protein